MSINGPRRTSNREMRKLRWSLKIEGVLGQIGTIKIDLEEILRGILDLLILR